MNETYKVFNIDGIINERIHFLENQRENFNKILDKLPEGILLVAPGNTGNSFRYYKRKSPQDKLGEYLGKEDDNLKKQLAFKKYVITACKSISDELEKLKKIQRMDVKDSLIDTYVDLSPGVKKLINPVVVDDVTYADTWQKIPYEGLKFSENDATQFYSDLGERMRSKSEVIIANQLLKHGIPYKYECPIKRANNEALYPDFTILDVKKRRVIYWEHLGKMGDMSYVARNLWKLDEYKKVGIFLGINLFVTYESDTSPLGINDIMRIIKMIQE